MNLLEELENLGAQIGRASDLDTLKTIFHRLEEICRENPDDFEVQLAASDLRQRLLDRGNRLRRAGAEQTRPAPPPRRPAATAPNRKIWIAVAVALIVLVGGAALARKRYARLAAASVPLEVMTVPPGAAVSINGEVQCTSNCRLTLPAGHYRVITTLEGYEAAESNVDLAAGKPASLILPLAVHARLRVLSNLDQGNVELDDEPLAELVEGQFILDRVAPGMHVLKVTGKNGEASLPFEIAAGQPPSVTGALTTKNLIALAVATGGNQARAFGNRAALKLSVNGQPQADAGPAGVEIGNVRPGLNELVIGEGSDQRVVEQDFGSGPMLTVFLKSDVNLGTLIVSTSEDDVRVFLNGKEYPRKTQKGQIRIQTIGRFNIRVAKQGFDELAPMTAEVRKGAETRVEFKLNRTPTTATLRVAGGIPGTEIFIDQRSAGVVGSDGGFANEALSPGEHAVELRRDQFVPKRYQRNFAAGQTVIISGGDALLVAERLPPPPPPPPKIEVPLKEKVAPPPPLPAGTVADFVDPSQWHQENGEYVHGGAGFLAYKIPPKGIFTFTVQLLKGGKLFRTGKVRWRLMYLDNRNYAEFEIDNNNFISRVVQDGKTFERTKTPIKDLEKSKQFTVLIDVSPDHIVHKLREGGAWAPLDAWSEPGVKFSDGKFGFFVQGGDEIALADFKFQPK